MRVHSMSNDMPQAPVEQPHGRLGQVTVERHIDVTLPIGWLAAVLKSRRSDLHRLRWLDNRWPGS